MLRTTQISLKTSEEQQKLRVAGALAADVLDMIGDHVRPGISTDELDGLTVTGEDWWFNVRPSNTEPLLRLNVEAADEPTLAAKRDEVLHIVRGG